MGGLLSRKEYTCVFCDIAQEVKDSPDAASHRVLAQNDTLLLISDIKPVAKHHYLVVPQVHISNPQTLKAQDHMTLIEEMFEFGKNYLEAHEELDVCSNALYGFHMPPFISVDHLHLHIICPASEMTFLHRQLFKPDSWYFVRPQQLIERLKSQQ